MRSLGILGVALAVALGGQSVDAGVEGVYGGVTYFLAGENQGESTGFETVEFDSAAGTYDVTYDGFFQFNDSGDYEEFDLFIVSFWNFEINNLLDSDYEVSGISLFGFITTYRAVEIEGDGSKDSFGILLRDTQEEQPE